MASVQCPAQPRVAARQTTVSVACQKKSLARKVTEGTGAFLLSAGLLTSSTFAFQNPPTKQLLVEFNTENSFYDPVVGPKQDEYQAMLKAQDEKMFGTLRRSPIVQALIKESKEREPEFERFRLLSSYANFERTQQSTNEGVCKFPTNFLGCDGKFAQTKWIKEKRAAECKTFGAGDCTSSPSLGGLSAGTKLAK